MSRSFIYASLFILFLTFLPSASPSISVRISSQKLVELKSTLLPVLIHELRKWKIPDIGYDALTFANIQLTDLDIPDKTTKFETSDSTINLRFENITAKLSFFAGRQILFFPFEIEVGSIVNVKYLNIQLALTSNSKSFFELANLDLELDSLKISLYGWWKFLVGYLIEDMIDDGSLQNNLQNSVESTFRTMVSRIVKEKEFPFYDPLSSSPIQADFKLMQRPLITPEDINLMINATFFIPGSSSNITFTNDVVPIRNEDASQAFQVFIGNHTLNSLFYTMWQSGWIWVNLTQQNTPSLEGIGLDSGSMSLAFPGLVAYGNDSPMTMICSALKDEGPMTATLLEDNMRVAGNLSCDVNVWGNNDWDRAVTIKFGTDSEMKLIAANSTVGFNLTNVDILKMKYWNSTIGKMSNKIIKDTFDMMLSFMLPISMSTELTDLPYIQLNNSVSHVKPGYLELLTDIDVNQIILEKLLQP